MPNTALVMVFMGWIIGTIVGTKILLKYTLDRKLAYYHAGILTVLAMVNNYLYIPSKWWVQVVTVPIFFVVVWVVIHFSKNK
jgi:hypothetical protein